MLLVVMLSCVFLRRRMMGAAAMALFPQGRRMAVRSLSGSGEDSSALLDLAAAIGHESNEGKARRSISAVDRKTVAYRQGYRCAGCDILLPPDHEIDHIVPVALNGSDSLSNLQALCVDCHRQKTRDQRHQILDDRKQRGAEKKKRNFFSRRTSPDIVLNEAQEEAVTTPLNESVRVVAGPGTGKTRVLIRRIEEILKRTEDPRSVLALTFTNKAAREMRERLGRSDVTIATFHGICLSMLRAADNEALPKDRRVGFACYGQKESLTVIKKCAARLGCGMPPSLAQAAISAEKNGREQKEIREEHKDFLRLKELYEAEMATLNAIDFDDMLLLALDMLRSDCGNAPRGGWRHVLVDEFQDTNSIQYEILRSLKSPIFAVGDGDQSIYGFRGAEYKNLARFDSDFPQRRLVKLAENYRSTQQIIDLYSSVILASSEKRDNNRLISGTSGEKPMVVRLYDSNEEAQFISDTVSRMVGSSTIAVLYRTNAQAIPFEERFLKDGVKYVVGRGKALLERREVRDIMAYLRLAAGSDDELSCERIINVPRRGIGSVTVNKLKNYRDGLGMLEAARMGREILGDTKIGEAVETFAQLVDDMREKAQTSTVADVIRHVVHATDYAEYLLKSMDKPEDRLDNVFDLATFAGQKTNLRDFLDDCVMVEDQDRQNVRNLDSDVPLVHLLTAHAAKGLEFDYVFVAGVEEMLFPHFFAMQEDSIEDERRLLYVALSRAKKQLYITLTMQRYKRGFWAKSTPSVFLGDIPRDHYRVVDLASSRTEK